jgi:tripartite-type tricarboxylate transporter receptor subunit TctC
MAVRSRKNKHERNRMKKCTAVIAMAGLLLVAPAAAENWPTKTVRVIVPFAAGSASDLVPRAVFEQIAANAGHSFVVDNRGGGGGAIGVNAVKLAEPDGYTILAHSNALVTSPAIQSMRMIPSRTSPASPRSATSRSSW